MTRRPMFMLLTLMMATAINAQRSKIDSLKQKVLMANEDSNKVLLLTKLGWRYQWSYPDSGILYAQQALELAQKINFASGEMSAYLGLGEALAGKGNYPKALDAKLKALDIAEKSRDSTDIVWALANVGAVYYYSKDYPNALYYFAKTKLNDKFFRSEQMLYSGFLAETYFYLDRLDSALYYAQMCYEHDLRASRHWPGAYTILGDIYSKKGHDTLALQYYHAGIDVSTEKLEFINGYNGIARVFTRIGRIDSSAYFARQAAEIAQKASFPSGIVDATEILNEIYSNSRETDSAFKYMQIMMVAKDSLYSQAKQNLSFNERVYQRELANEKIQLQNKTKIYALLGALAVFLLIAFLLYRNNRQRQKAYSLLQTQKYEIDLQKSKVEQTLDELKSAQAQLIQSAKMASLGELTAGIAHEIQNPLNFVNNFSDVNTELIDELKQERNKAQGTRNEELENEILNSIQANEEKINHHGKRADSIVKGMLQHSRTSSGQKELTDINALADEYLRLAYHGLRAKDKSFSAKFETDFDDSIEKIKIVPQDIGRVILNLINNAFFAVNEKAKQSVNDYEPTVRITTRSTQPGRSVEIKVIDNGAGIPRNIVDKIFQPFFTTKPTGQGTGLGLSLAYDIIKAHGGEIRLETMEGEGSEFAIQLPVSSISS